MEFLKSCGNELFKVHITSNGVPGRNVDIETINAINAAKNKIMAIIIIPFGLFSVILILLYISDLDHGYFLLYDLISISDQLFLYV